MANNPQQKVFEDPELRLIEGREEQIFGGRQQARQQRKASLMKRGGLADHLREWSQPLRGP
jgi:hypothetical protein